MAIQIYPDGFPNTPSEAIEFSYFLSESEKAEWREWLGTASDEQKEELVDILHSMWQDNQKNAVPESFANNITNNPDPFGTQPVAQNFSQAQEFDHFSGSQNPPAQNNFANQNPPVFNQPAPAQFQPQPQQNPFGQQPAQSNPNNNYHPQAPQNFSAPQFNQNPAPFLQDYPQNLPQQPQPVFNQQSNFGDYSQPQAFQPQPVAQNFSQAQEFDHFSGSQNPPAPQNNFANQNPPVFNQPAPAQFQPQPQQNPFGQQPQSSPASQFVPNPLPQIPTQQPNFGDYSQPQTFQPQPVAQNFSEPSAKPVFFAQPPTSFDEPHFEPIKESPELPSDLPAIPQKSDQSKPKPPQPEIADPKKEDFVNDNTQLKESPKVEEEIESMEDFVAQSADLPEVKKEAQEKPQPKPAQKPDPFKVKDNFDLSLDIPKNDKNFQPKKKEDINMESLVKDNKYRPNPLLDDADNQKANKKEDIKFEYKSKNPKPKTFSEESKPNDKEPPKDNSRFEFTPQIKRNNNTSKPNSNQDLKPKNEQKSKDSFNNSSKEEKPTNNSDFGKDASKNPISFSDLKETGTKEMLNEIYQDYVSTYDTNQRKFMNFLERITKLLSNYENIADHFEDLTKKLLKMNDTIVAQAKDIQLLKNNSQTQGDTPVQVQIDDLQYDLDKLEKEVRTLRTENRRRLDSVDQQLAAVGADNYKENGVMQKIELLKSEIQEIKSGQTSNIVKFNRDNSNSESDQQANNIVRVNRNNPEETQEEPVNNIQKFNPNSNRRNQDRNRQSDRNFNNSRDQAVVKKSNLDLTGIL
jgi:hypothetical protein